MGNLSNDGHHATASGNDLSTTSVVNHISIVIEPVCHQVKMCVGGFLLMIEISCTEKMETVIETGPVSLEISVLYERFGELASVVEW